MPFFQVGLRFRRLVTIAISFSCEPCLKGHRNGLYTSLLLTGKLTAHLNEIDDAAHERMDLLIRQMAERQHIGKALKARDQMGWIGAMNNIRNAAEEIVLSDEAILLNSAAYFHLISSKM